MLRPRTCGPVLIVHKILLHILFQNLLSIFFILRKKPVFLSGGPPPPPTPLRQGSPAKLDVFYQDLFPQFKKKYFIIYNKTPMPVKYPPCLYQQSVIALQGVRHGSVRNPSWL